MVQEIRKTNLFFCSQCGGKQGDYASCTEKSMHAISAPEASVRRILASRRPANGGAGTLNGRYAVIGPFARGQANTLPSIMQRFSLLSRTEMPEKVALTSISPSSTCCERSPLMMMLQVLPAVQSLQSEESEEERPRRIRLLRN